MKPKRITHYAHAMQSIVIKKHGMGAAAFYLVTLPADDRLPTHLPTRADTFSRARALRKTFARYISLPVTVPQVQA